MSYFQPRTASGQFSNLPLSSLSEGSSSDDTKLEEGGNYYFYICKNIESLEKYIDIYYNDN